MHLLFPSSPIDSRKPDELTCEQFEAFRQAGYSASLISIENLQQGMPKISPPTKNTDVLYRGWMLGAHEYKLMGEAIAKDGAWMKVSLEQYLSSHHLPNWYSKIQEFTPETVIMAIEEATPESLTSLGWSGFFIKDFVKSLKTSNGSLITNSSQLPELLHAMRHFRGHIEGGICVRKIESFKAESEVRYFVIEGIPFSPIRTAAIPEIVLEVANRIPSPFFSVDIAQRDDGVLRVIEIGDGQVSDLVGWTAERFVEIFQHRT